MFLCEQCGEMQDPHTSPIMVVTEVAIAIYPNWTQGKDQHYFETQGTRIIKEKKMCQKCAEAHPGPSIVGTDKYSEADKRWVRIDHRTGFIPKEKYGLKNVALPNGNQP